MKSKKAAMEMSVGTIVTIVLLMTVLILGLVMVKSIFSGAVENIDGIDQAVKNEINSLFAEDNTRRIVIYPPTRKVSVKKGEEAGFGFSIRNNGQGDETFSYVVGVNEVAQSCQMTEEQAENLISLGKTESYIIPSGDALENPVLVTFNIPETASICDIRYGIDVTKSDGSAYLPTVTVDLKIK